MNGFMKVLTSILGVMAVLACLGTVAIIGYSFVNAGKSDGNGNGPKTEAYVSATQDTVGNTQSGEVPTASPEADGEKAPVPLRFDPTHVHDYQPTVIKKATCYESGLIRYECVCGDYYEVDQLSTGHLPDEWVVVKEPTNNSDGLKERRCIYCNEVVGSEVIPANSDKNGTNDVDDNGVPVPKHEHMYVSTVEREPTCTLAGLRKRTCSCGSFYTETIPAVGHVAEDWKTAEEPTATSYGTSQRVCSVCGALLDTKVLPLASPTPGASASPSATASASATPKESGSPKPSSSPTPSPTPHVHNYSNYVVTPANCTQKGVRSYICTCGSSYAESIELDLNNHSFEATFVAPTETQQGYTVYTCTRCNYSYMDNYIMPLSNAGSSSGGETDDE